MTISIANSEAITRCDAVVDSCDTGTTNAQATLIFYNGTVPARISAALSGNVALASLNMSATAFGAAVDVPASNLARATANTISDDTNAASDTDTTCTFYRILDRDNTPRIQGSVTATGGGGDIELDTVSITAGVTVSVTSLTYDDPEN